MYFRPQAELLLHGHAYASGVSATKNGAIILGREEALGTLEQGKLADLQLVDANPRESFQPLGRPSLVMIGGAVVRYQGKR